MVIKPDKVSFNLNTFLNDLCKDSINWDEFVIMVLQLNLQYNKTISDTNIVKSSIIDQLEKLGVYKRPIHCMDLKRKKITIKINNTWEHDQSIMYDTIEKFIKSISYVNINNVNINKCIMGIINHTTIQK